MMDEGRTASLYRMATDEHLCPSGLKSHSLLKRNGFEVDDNLLTTRDQQDAFKVKHDVKTTPQTYIQGERIGGYEDLKRHLGYHVRSKDETTYVPIVALFATTAMMALISPPDVAGPSDLAWLVAPVGLFIGTIGAVSVVKAVYTNEREIKCACVGGGSNVPLGFVSLTENLVMIVMGLWMLAMWFAA